MTSLEIGSPQVQDAVQKGVEWLNRMSNSMHPMTIIRVEDAQLEANSNITLKVALNLEGQERIFRLVVNPAGEGPEVLPDFKQLN